RRVEGADADDLPFGRVEQPADDRQLEAEDGGGELVARGMAFRPGVDDQLPRRLAPGAGGEFLAALAERRDRVLDAGPAVVLAARLEHAGSFAEVVRQHAGVVDAD